MYQADLSFSRYSRRTYAYGPVLAIGWLEPEYDFPVGKVPIPFLRKLLHIIYNQEGSIIHLYRGFHTSNIEKKNKKLRAYYQKQLTDITEEHALGNGELHFLHQNRFYCCPTMISEYIIEYGYCPPQVFIDAVMEGELVTEDTEESYFQIDPETIYQSTDRPREVKELIDKALQMFQVKNYRIGYDLLLKARKKSPEDPIVLTNLSSVYLDLGRPKKSLAIAQELLKLLPNDFYGFGLKGYAYFNLKQYDQAKENLELILPTLRHTETQNLPNILLRLGESEEQLGNSEQAKTYFREALQLNPEDEYIRSKLYHEKAKIDKRKAIIIPALVVLFFLFRIIYRLIA